LSGTLPPDFGLLSKLRSFHVATNRFEGRLPENLCYHGELQNLTAYENHLSGELPESLGNCSSLLEVKIYSNEFYGKIPSGLWRAENLVYFMISHNKFNGELPQNLSSSISLLDISYNQFSGEIPIGVSSWTNVVEFIASKNYLNGSIPQELTSLHKLQTLSLDQNQLKGPLPFDVISWNSLLTLNLSQNQLSGEIPASIGYLPDLSVLDLSDNQFSGEIPSIAPRITVLNLSSNRLTGRVPSAFENSAYDRSFLNNSGLCADTPKLNLTLCNSNSNTQSESKDSSLSPALIVILVVVSILAASLVSFVIIKLYSKRKQGSDNSSWKLTSFQRLNFTESDIVSSMTENNIIGSGGYGTVYKVAVDGLGYVAVKKIWENKKLDQNLEKSFHTEVKILSSIRHRNIVKLLCCISNDDTMLLVYEYVENRSLDRWLQKKKTVKSSTLLSRSVHHVVLDWPKRLQIAVGVAQGLSYMHHECSPPVVHRDVKTSNILLDAQFNAKVADFGLARMLISPGEVATMSAVIGSFGYMAPGEIHDMPIFCFSCLQICFVVNIFLMFIYILDLIRMHIHILPCQSIMQKGYAHAFHLLSYPKCIYIPAQETGKLAGLTRTQHYSNTNIGRPPHNKPKLNKKLETFLRPHNRYTAAEPENLLQSAGRKIRQPILNLSNPSPPYNNMDPKTIRKKGTYAYLIYFHFQDNTLISSTASKISECLFSKIRAFLVFQRIHVNQS